MNITLDAHLATELADKLAIIEDWLLHAEPHVLADLTDFAFYGACSPRHAVTALIDDLGGYSVLLRHNTDTDTDQENHT